MLWILVLVGGAIVVVVAATTWFWRSVKTLKCKGGVIYYRSPVTVDEAQHLRGFLERSDFFNPTLTAVGLEKETGTYHFRLVVTDETRQDEEALIECAVLAAGLSDEVFAGGAVDVQLCDGWWRTRTVVPHCGRFGERFRFNAAQVFYTPGVTEYAVITLGMYLMWKGFFDDSRKLAQLNRTANGFELRMQVHSENELGPMHRADIQRMTSDLSRDVFQGQPVEVHPCEGVRKTLNKEVAKREQQPNRNPNRVWSGPVTYRIQQPPAAPSQR